MVTAAATVIDPDVTPAAIPIHLDPKLARRRRDATSRYKLLTDQQQGTFIVGEMPNGLRRARLLTRYRQVRHEIEARKSEAPVSFEYDDVVADVNHDAARIEDVHWIERPVHLRFTIWTPVAWMVAHGRAVYLRHHVGRTRTYHDGLEDRYLLECHPPYSDLLWFGEGLARGGFIRTGRSIDGPGSSTRRRDPSAPTWGDIHFAGLLMPCAGLSNWIAFRYPEAILIEPETLYRGVLYGSAYSVLGLTSGARFYELAQISLDRFEEPRPYKVLRGGEPTGKLDLIYLQRLLPKGCTQETERQLFNVSGGIDLLLEIAERLQGHYGEVPVVPPEREKSHCLRPERYLFQWGGRAVTLHDTNVLIKFMVGDLEFRDTEGRPFKISSQLYRHAGQTAARYNGGVPASVIAEVGLHHRLAGDRVPEATEYLHADATTTALGALPAVPGPCSGTLVGQPARWD